MSEPNFAAQPTSDLTPSVAYRYRLCDLPGPKSLPILGNMHQIKPNEFHLCLERWARQYGRSYQVHLGRNTALVVTDPALFIPLLRDRPENFTRFFSLKKIIEESGVCGIFTAEGEDWRMQRKLLMRAFTPELVRRFFPHLQTMTERLRLHWQRAAESGQSIDILRDLKSFALDITIAFAYGQDINSVEQPNNPMQQDIDILFGCINKRMFSPIPYWRYFSLPSDYAFAAALARVNLAVKGYLKQTRELLLAEPERRLKPSNLMETLLVARDEPGSGFEDSHIIGNAMTAVFAGEDTTANSIGWLINALATAPKASQAIRTELDALYPNHSILPDYAMLQHLPWLDAALNESMRLTPVAPLLGLECTRETVVGDVLLAKHSKVLILTRTAGMCSTHFPEPEKFLPERWLGDAAPDLIKKIMPFGGGPRLCPGRFLALTEIKMIVSMLVKNFDIHLQSGVPVDEVFSFTMTPSCLPVTLTPRVAAGGN